MIYSIYYRLLRNSPIDHFPSGILAKVEARNTNAYTVSFIRLAIGDSFNTKEQSEKLNLYGTVWLSVWKKLACVLTSKLLKTALIDILHMVLQWMKKVQENKQSPSNNTAPTKNSIEF